MLQATIPLTAPLSFTVPDTEDTVDDSELIGDYLDILLDSTSNDQEETEVKINIQAFFPSRTRPER